MIRIAHLSDPHFAEITYSPKQLFSKRWLGNTNLILFRKKVLQTEPLQMLPKLLKSLDLDAVCITGDLTTTSLQKEFEKAREFVEAIKQEGLRVFVLPGNHDIYTRESEKSRRFYSFFPSAEERIIKHALGQGWWWVSLDTALATSLIFSHGKFFKEMEPLLQKTLSDIPKNEKIIIGNHFPLFKTGKPRHDLWRAEKLQGILKAFSNVKVYLHGHDHLPYQIDRQQEGFPLVFNAGSCSHTPNGTFNVYELNGDKCLFNPYIWNNPTWIKGEQKQYAFTDKDA